RRVRRAREPPRRAPDRRLLRDDTGRERGDPLRRRGSARAERAARRARARAARAAARRGAVRDRARPQVTGHRVDHVRRARPAEGARNVLSVTGDPPEIGDYTGSRGVYEVDSIGLSQIVTRLNHGEDYNGKGIDAPTSYYLGVAVNPSADDLETELERFRQKVEAGARFAMTQALFDLSYLDRFEEQLGGWPVPLLVGIFYVRSHQLAVRLH